MLVLLSASNRQLANGLPGTRPGLHAHPRGPAVQRNAEVREEEQRNVSLATGRCHLKAPGLDIARTRGLHRPV